jgi:replicative DNA helicase
MSRGSSTSDSLPDAAILPTERALLGAMLLDGCDRIPPLLPNEFYLDRHRMIWQAMCELAEGCDGTTLARELGERGQLEAAGGVAYIAQLLEEGVTAHLVSRYAQDIRGAARQRAIRRLGLEMQRQGLDAEEIQRRLAEMPGPMASSVETIGDIWARIKAGWHQPFTRIDSGLKAVDAIQEGISPGEILVVAGRTSHAKTAMLCHLAVAIAEQGYSVEFISLEETVEAITRRCVANRTGLVSYKMLRTGNLLAPELEEAEKAVAHLEDLPLRITAVSTLQSLDEDHVCGVVAASTAQVVIVDHLQKVSTRGDSRAYGLERAMNRFHAAALRDHRVVILAVQINRGMETEQKPRAPRLADLRDSGAIEIIARSIWLLYWPWKHDSTKPFDRYELYVAKHSDGGTGKADLIFQPQYGLFADLPAVIDQHIQAQAAFLPPGPGQADVPF